METQSGGRLCALVLLWALSCAGTHQGEEVIYFRERGELKLRPSVGGSVTAVTWKHGSSLVTEWMEEGLPLIYYGGYQGRATLNTSNGELLIRDAALNDSGEYTLELNGVIQERPYVARLLPQLPTPLISVEPSNCSDESYDCVLVCGGVMEVTEVSYDWRVGDGPWKKGQREKHIHNDEETQEVKEFTCRVENPLENRESKATRNPFYQQPLDNKDIDLGFNWGLFHNIAIPISWTGLCVIVVYVMYKKREALRSLFHRLCASRQRNPHPAPAAQSVGLLSVSRGRSAAASAPPQSAAINSTQEAASTADGAPTDGDPQ